eukprot:TRINITY_DN6834_c0_g2_i1.p1 TRINITY_DN6834_c0_g2~~TRINITY_DN6834_c0_g2_i1.p1  ORF type:complete len:350 (+),score=82.97 TRINITY_DN6834_c0_g2_i1:65-1114(+)
MSAAAKERRTAVLHGVRDMRIEMRPALVPGEGEALVRVVSVAICGTDHGYFNTCSVAGRKMKFPDVFSSRFGGVIGHECAGVVESVGSGVTSVKPGDRVCVEPGIPRLRPGDDRAGQQTYLGSLMSDYPGALAEHIVHPAAYLHVLPDGVSMDEGALVEPLAVALNGVRRADVKRGERVLVCGAGPIGLMAMLCCKSRGAEVAALDLEQARLDVAASLGATAVRGGGNLAGLGTDYDKVLECTGAAPVVQTALERVRRGGTVVLVGYPGSAAGINMALIPTREVVVTGIFRYADAFEEAFRMVCDGDIDVKQLITHHLPLSRVSDAFSKEKCPGAVKVIVHPTDPAARL